MARFIGMEGLDGSGKTSVLKALENIINEEEMRDQIVFTREPGGLADLITESLRLMILDHEHDPLTEAYLFAAARARHCHLIRGIMKEGKDVITDRFAYSSIYYQGSLRNLGAEKVYEINKAILKDVLDLDIIIYLKVNPEVRAERLKGRDEENRLDLLKMVDEDPDVAYIETIKKYKKEDAVLLSIDTSDKTPEDIAEIIFSCLYRNS